MGKIKKDKISKNSHQKKKKIEVPKKRKNCEKKKGVSDEGSTRKYGYISAKSVITMAEAAGFSGLQEEVAKNLAEDVTYRLRYLIQQCKKYMIHNRHNKLSCADINEVLKMCDVPTIYGYTVDEPLQNFIYIKEADVFVLEDNLIDLPSLALTEIKVQPKSSYVATGYWLKPEETRQEVKTKNEEAKQANSEAQVQEEKLKQGYKSSTQPDNQKPGSENVGSETKIPTNLIKYYGITCNTILGHSDLKIVFQDLSTSSRILPIVPYLLNFITIALNKLGSERQIKRLLQTVEALSRNTTIDFSPYSATTRVINTMLLIVAIDKKPAKFSYDYHMRSYAARVLAAAVSQWCIRDEQKLSIIKKMGKLLTDFKASPKVHYGALTLLTAMGPEALSNSLQKIIMQYLGYLEESKLSANGYSISDIAMLEEIILAAAASIYRNPKLQGSSLSDLDFCLNSYFGDSLCSIWPRLSDDPRLSPWGNKFDFPEPVTELKYSKSLKYMNSRYKPKAKKLTLENVFNLPKSRKRKNTRIIFKFAGAIPVPEVNLKRRRFDGRCSQFIAGKESEGHVVVAGKRFRYRSLKRPPPLSLIPVGYIFSIL